MRISPKLLFEPTNGIWLVMASVKSTLCPDIPPHKQGFNKGEKNETNV